MGKHFNSDQQRAYERMVDREYERLHGEPRRAREFDEELARMNADDRYDYEPPIRRVRLFDEMPHGK